MIILDEQIKSRSVIRSIEVWYPGNITHIQTVRPNTVIKDDNIATLLLQARQPIFVTINVSDFWRKINAHPQYCVIAIELIQQDYMELPGILRPILNLPELRTRSLRMGKVIRVRGNRVDYYGRDGQIHSIE
ncbi:MAG: hypothetical protein AAF639_13410 [Chloroflexota bacterium]